LFVIIHLKINLLNFISFGFGSFESFGFEKFEFRSFGFGFGFGFGFDKFEFRSFGFGFGFDPKISFAASLIFRCFSDSKTFEISIYNKL
jgi:hypothetical protein